MTKKKKKRVKKAVPVTAKKEEMMLIDEMKLWRRTNWVAPMGCTYRDRFRRRQMPVKGVKPPCFSSNER